MGQWPLLSDFEVNALLKLFLAILLGGAIGLEREFRGRPAGLRTHILVCLRAPHPPSFMRNFSISD